MARPSGLRYRLHSAAGAGQVLDPTGSGGTSLDFVYGDVGPHRFPFLLTLPQRARKRENCPLTFPLLLFLSFHVRRCTVALPMPAT